LVGGISWFESHDSPAGGARVGRRVVYGINYVYVMGKVPKYVYVTHLKLVDVHAILDGWRVNRGVRGCVKTVLPLCAIKG
jgi:hypothetical protein